MIRTAGALFRLAGPRNHNICEFGIVRLHHTPVTQPFKEPDSVSRTLLLLTSGADVSSDLNNGPCTPDRPGVGILNWVCNKADYRVVSAESRLRVSR